MKLLGLALAVAFAASTGAPAKAEALQPLGKSWSWASDVAPGTLELNIVRGNVTVLPTSGEARIVVNPANVAAQQVSMRVRGSPHGLTFEDVYPAAGDRFGECPLPNDRGYFWQSDGRLDVVLYLPGGTRPKIHVMDGLVSWPKQ